MKVSFQRSHDQIEEIIIIAVERTKAKVNKMRLYGLLEKDECKVYAYVSVTTPQGDKGVLQLEHLEIVSWIIDSLLKEGYDGKSIEIPRFQGIPAEGSGDFDNITCSVHCNLPDVV